MIHAYKDGFLLCRIRKEFQDLVQYLTDHGERLGLDTS